MNDFIDKVKSYSREPVNDLDEGLKRLRDIRKVAYENLNQIQLEYLILQGAAYLEKEYYSDHKIEWYWNPRQTGDSSEPVP